MRHRYSILFSALLLLAMLPLLSATAPAKPPVQKHYGYVAKDRWDQWVLTNGTSIVFMFDETARYFNDDMQGTPLAIQATKVEKQADSGTLLIKAVNGWSSTGYDNTVLFLSAGIDEEPAVAGQGIKLRIAVSNLSKKPVVLPLDSLAVVFVTNAPQTNKEMGMTDPKAPLFWQRIFRYKVSNDCTLCEATRKVIPAWPLEKALACEGVTEAKAADDKTIAKTVSLAPKAMLEAEVTVGQDLPPGEYELFCYHTQPRPDGSCSAMSARLPFIVTKKDAVPK